MDQSEAKIALRSDSTEVRLASARHYAKSATRTDRERLQIALKKETVPWIRRALEVALDRTLKPHGNRKEPKPIEDIDDLKFDIQEIRAKISEEVSEEFVHEFAPLVGILATFAPLEVQEYDQSNTRRVVEHFQSLLRALRDLKKANATPRYTHFKIKDLLDFIIQNTSNEIGAAIFLAGAPSMSVSADRDQLGLAFSNGLRNAIEAVTDISSVSPPQIVVNWGYTQTDNFLVIKDTGPGFQGDPMDALKRSSTSKVGHAGYGLTLAHKAMVSMQGSIYVKSEFTGAHFEIRWFRNNENSIR